MIIAVVIVVQSFSRRRFKANNNSKYITTATGGRHARRYSVRFFFFVFVSLTIHRDSAPADYETVGGKRRAAHRNRAGFGRRVRTKHAPPDRSACLRAENRRRVVRGGGEKKLGLIVTGQSRYRANFGDAPIE